VVMSLCTREQLTVRPTQRPTGERRRLLQVARRYIGHFIDGFQHIRLRRPSCAGVHLASHAVFGVGHGSPLANFDHFAMRWPSLALGSSGGSAMTDVHPARGLQTAAIHSSPNTYARYARSHFNMGDSQTSPNARWRRDAMAKVT